MGLICLEHYNNDATFLEQDLPQAYPPPPPKERKEIHNPLNDLQKTDENTELLVNDISGHR